MGARTERAGPPTERPGGRGHGIREVGLNMYIYICIYIRVYMYIYIYVHILYIYISRKAK